jgi:multiple sugar transport system permease protein
MATSQTSRLITAEHQLPRLAKLNLRQREAIFGYLFISPWLIGLFLFFIVPFAASFYLSFTSYSILSPGRWVGLDNYVRALTQDPVFWHSLGITALYVSVTVILRIVLGFGLALLLNSKVRFIGFWRTLFYLPSIIPLAALSVIWMQVLDGRSGLLNQLLSLFGIGHIRWLTDPDFALTGLIIMSTVWVGTTMVIFLAGLQNLPEEYFEASRIDGATNLQQLRFIIIPLMTPTIYFNLLINIINAFQVFSQALIMTQGGPQDATRFYMLYVYDNAFRYTPAQMGYASALAWILFVIILVFTLLIVVSSRRWVFYGD